MSPARATATAATAPAVDAVRAVARVARLLERAAGDTNLAHYRVLSAIASGEERASRIAERLALGKPAVSSAVDALCQRGLLVRAPSHSDQRAVTLRLTPEGHDLLDRVERDMCAQLRDLVARTPDPAAVLGSLASLDAAVEEIRAERAAARRSTS